MFRLTAHESRVRVCAVYTLFKNVCFKFYFEFISCICQKQHLRNSEPALQDRHLHISHQPITWQHEDTVETTSRSSNWTSERGRKAIRVALDAKEHLWRCAHKNSSRSSQWAWLLSANNTKLKLQFTQAHQNGTLRDWKNMAADGSQFLLQDSESRIREHNSHFNISIIS